MNLALNYQTSEEIGSAAFFEAVRQRNVGPAWLWECDKCDLGILNRDDWPQRPIGQTVEQHKVNLYSLGLIHFCDCRMGETARRNLLRYIDAETNFAAQVEREAQEAQRRRLARIFADAEVPPRYADLKFSYYKRLAQDAQDSGKYKAIAAVEEYYKTGQVGAEHGKRNGLYLYGATDQGKTGCLSPLFLHFVNLGNSGLWVQFNDLMAALKDFASGKVEERVRTCQQVEYLMIDDFGDPASLRNATDYTRETMFRIINYRNDFQKPTFITSNLHPDHMASQFDERTTKRVQELCAIVEVKGKPMRELLKGAA